MTCVPLAAPLCLALAQATATAPAPPATRAVDARDGYDVETYRLDLRIEPDTQRVSGEVAVEARVVAAALDALVLDFSKDWTVDGCRLVARPLASKSALDGQPVPFTHTGAVLACKLDPPAALGTTVRLVVRYSGHPKARDEFTGFHWAKTGDGRPWISTSCQDTGSAAWWPSKDSFFHPEDKPARVFLNYTVPQGLYAVGNGRLDARASNDDGTETFRWVHEYPLETYSVTLNVAPYVVVEQALAIDGIEGPVPFLYYVLPENAEKAALQFQDVPKMIEIYSRCFGPFPFPKSKFALVETSFWGMEHSTAVAYGSSYPAWIRAHGGKDRYGSRNALFDYILVHESAHEWWGNAVSARTWGDFWIHEGFATYAEAVYLEFTAGADVAQKHLDAWKRGIGKSARLYRGADVNSGQAYSNTIYSKGAWVLHTLRHFVQDDDAWWRTLAAFNREFRYQNAATADFRAVLERETKREWKTFFDEWVYGAGQPKLTGHVRVQGATIRVEVANDGSGPDGFHVPLDLAWRDDGGERARRVWLAPGKNEITVECPAPPRDVRSVGLERVLCENRVTVE